MNRYTKFRNAIITALVNIKVFTTEQATATISLDTSDVELASLGIDSMSVIDLCMDVEESTGREVLIEELIDNPTLNKLAKFLSEH
jgi:acyl carrier protein